MSEKMALSVADAAELLGVSKPTVYQLAKREDFPAFTIGRRTVISRVKLAEWVNNQATKTAV